MASFFRQLGLLIFFFALSVPEGRGNPPLQEQSEQFFNLPLDGTITVDNLSGAIHIFGWYQPKVRLAALRKAYTAPRLHQIRVETVARSHTLAVRTVIPEATGFFADRSGTVEYSINVPEPARLVLKQGDGEITLQGLRGAVAEIEMMNGRVIARNCFAQVRARGVHGVMEVFFDWWENLPATFACVLQHGRMGARLPREAHFKVEARTTNGRIHQEFALPAPATTGAGQSLQAATASQSPVSLGMATGGGNITIEVTR